MIWALGNLGFSGFSMLVLQTHGYRTIFGLPKRSFFQIVGGKVGKKRLNSLGEGGMEVVGCVRSYVATFGT